MKKMLLFIVFVMFFSLFISCGKNSEKSDFPNLISESSSYKATGVMESFYPSGRKQNNFEVLYKSKENIKVTLVGSVEEKKEDKQIILKNTDGVFVLIPSINKNFRIKSEWPVGTSYPYLLYSLVCDIKNDENVIVSEKDDYITYETKTKMYKNEKEYKEKIIVDKNKKLPEEVLIYDEEDNLFIRVVFSSIELNKQIDNKEFILDDAMKTLKEEYGDDFVFENRSLKYPTVYPSGMKLTKENTVTSDDGKEVISIMKYAGEELSFTLIEEYVNMKENPVYQQETGEIITVLGNLAIVKDNGIITIYKGIEYTIASNNMAINDMIDVIGCFMYDDEK